MSDRWLVVIDASQTVESVVIGQPTELPTGRSAYPAPDGASIGWQRQPNGTFALPMPALSQADLYAYASARRYQLETTGSVNVGGAAVPTDERTRGVVTAGYVKASADATFTIDSWKIAPGVYVTLDAPTIIAVGDALTASVQALFDRNRVVDARIAAGTITTMAAVDAAFAAV